MIRDAYTMKKSPTLVIPGPLLTPNSPPAQQFLPGTVDNCIRHFINDINRKQRSLSQADSRMQIGVLAS